MTISPHWPYPTVLAHRGGGKLAPENTLAAFRCGLAHGFHAVEFDVMLSKDLIPILMHDEILGRTVSGLGKIADYTAEELSKMDAGQWFNQEFKHEPIPTYWQVLEFCHQHHIWMNVEIKPSTGFEEITGEIVAETTKKFYQSHPVTENNKLPLLSSFSFDALLAAQKTAPEIARAYLVNHIPNEWHTYLTKLNAVALHVNQKHLNAEMAHTIKQTRFGLFTYTVNDIERAQTLLKWGVDAFCTDRIDLIPHDFILS